MCGLEGLGQQGCCENMLFPTKVQGINSLSIVLNSEVSFAVWLSLLVLHGYYSEINSVLTGKCLSLLGGAKMSLFKSDSPKA